MADLILISILLMESPPFEIKDQAS